MTPVRLGGTGDFLAVGGRGAVFEVAFGFDTGGYCLGIDAGVKDGGGGGDVGGGEAFDGGRLVGGEALVFAVGGPEAVFGDDAEVVGGAGDEVFGGRFEGLGGSSVTGGRSGSTELGTGVLWPN